MWKPRSRPDTFQGAGEQALAWLQEVQTAYGVPVATEVATAEHAQAAMRAGMDYLWIGARTSANPIAVQAIADAIIAEGQKSEDRSLHSLKGLFIKNPVNADAELWLGNIARLAQTGAPVAAIHRGCNHRPCWAMAHTVRSARPDIPMLLDPSHMSGEAAQVPVLLRHVEELGLDGAMIEVHAHPEDALSDAAQQIRPEDLRHWLTDRSTHRPTRTDRNAEHVELNWLRAEIDELDDRLWETIAARMEVSGRIGAWKRAHGVAALQPERYQAIKERLQENGGKLGLPDTFIETIWNTIHEESLRKQA